MASNARIEASLVSVGSSMKNEQLCMIARQKWTGKGRKNFWFEISSDKCEALERRFWARCYILQDSRGEIGGVCRGFRRRSKLVYFWSC